MINNVINPNRTPSDSTLIDNNESITCVMKISPYPAQQTDSKFM